MEKDLIRLECLKITYSHGRSAAEAVERAQILEKYIWSEPEEYEKIIDLSAEEVAVSVVKKLSPTVPKEAVVVPKRSGKPNILS